MLCVTTYRANKVEPWYPRWPPSMEMLVAQVRNVKKADKKVVLEDIKMFSV